MTVEEYVISTRSMFDTDGRYAVEDVLLRPPDIRRVMCSPNANE
jgi:hypothetical protein